MTRLGSIFLAATLGCAAPALAADLDHVYAPLPPAYLVAPPPLVYAPPPVYFPPPPLIAAVPIIGPYLVPVPVYGPPPPTVLDAYDHRYDYNQ